MSEIIKKLIEDSLESKKAIFNIIPEIEKSAELLRLSLKDGNKILICGNGGSASQSQHFAAELVGRFEAERKGISCISLTVDTSNITAIANDYGFEFIFSKQIEALGREGDVLIALSTSGNSKNIIKAIEESRAKNMKIINLIGKDGGKMKGMADIDLIVPDKNTARIQEGHILVLHILAKLVEDAFLTTN
ncbi:MAG: D-sedoheptulose 7-phosphate isomerase [archaeon]